MTCNENSGFIAPAALVVLNRLVSHYQHNGIISPVDAYEFAALLSLDAMEITQIVNVLDALQGLVTPEVLRAAGSSLLDNTGEPVGPTPVQALAVMYFVLANAMSESGENPIH
jgi:hypothetical protein